MSDKGHGKWARVAACAIVGGGAVALSAYAAYRAWREANPATTSASVLGLSRLPTPPITTPEGTRAQETTTTTTTTTNRGEGAGTGGDGDHDVLVDAKRVVEGGAAANVDDDKLRDDSDDDVANAD
ncbi:hypothetical protein Pelo_3110 [Pelomyxa schiedti]|nr:hypothetical protein Pelo_3110 [Pelomyxa schiedti]